MIMCLAIPGRIKKIEGRKAWVEYEFQNTEYRSQESEFRIQNSGEKKNLEVREALVGEAGVEIGDWVMVQMGIISRKLSEKEAREMLKGWGGIF